ncbi:PepSY domain-containing protein [Rhodoblastus sp.]|uniref:PepSY domain-containing protein n=1 Tax=Rhodoblastus sp. TaxID=1962975 RepID=UPI0025F677F7|nr:PepSY domain-containing protein [Rhodoblastus sp.]
MRKLIVLASLATLLGAAGAAQAGSLGRPCTDKPASAFLSLDVLKSKVAAMGYQVRDVAIKKACGEFYVIDKTGKKGELFVDPTSGVIVAGGVAN